MTLRYQDYVNSQIPWLGEIPAHWRTLPLFSVLTESKVKNVGMVESNLLSLSYGRIVRKDISTNEGLLPESFGAYQVVNPGDIVFRFTDLQNDKRSLRSARVVERGIITSAYCAARPTGLDARYADYLMRSYDTTKVFYGLGGGVRQSLKFSDVARLPILVPPLAEQQAIADYLDRETAKIDTLIEKQQRLVEVLRERRWSCVASAISEIEGPRAALRHFSRLVSGSGFPVEAQGQSGLELPFFKVKDLKSADGNGVLVTAEDTISRETAAGLRAAVIPAGSLVFAKVGAALMLGRVGALPVDGCIDNNMSAVIFDATFDPSFARYVMLTFDFTLFVQPGAVPSLNMNGLREFRIPVLPLDEQLRIVAYLDEQTAKIDTLIEKTERFIELSRERRSALITAAVTGQIDVRDKVA